MYRLQVYKKNLVSTNLKRRAKFSLMWFNACYINMQVSKVINKITKLGRGRELFIIRIAASMEN